MPTKLQKAALAYAIDNVKRAQKAYNTAQRAAARAQRAYDEASIAYDRAVTEKEARNIAESPKGEGSS